MKFCRSIPMALLLTLCFAGCIQAQLPSTAAEAESWIQHMAKLHTPLGEPQAGDWLIDHNEKGQSIVQYGKSGPNQPNKVRNKLYIVILGEPAPKQKEILSVAESYLTAFYGLPTRRLAPIPLEAIPDTARRMWDSEQFLTPYLLHEVLAPDLPEDAFAYLMFTTEDLYPKESWFFVFGQASLRERVGVWSMHRYGDPEEDEAAYELALIRTLNTSAHETGHMFGIKHCTRFECAMAGSNSLEESDRRPNYFCPQCDLKVCGNTQTDPVARYLRLAQFWADLGQTATAKYYQEAAELAQSAP